MKAAAGTLAALALLAAGIPARADTARVIGVAAPLSGSDAVFGTQIRLGVEQAVADANTAGGLRGARLSVVLGDDLDDPKRGADVAADFLRKKIDLVVGPFSSSVSLPASAVYAAGGVLVMSPAASAPRFTERGLATVFRLCGRDDQQALVAARFLLGRHETKVAVLHDRTTAGKTLADAFRKALAAGGTHDVLYASIDKGDKDFGVLAARIKASGARVAFWGGTQTEAGLLARALHDGGGKTVLMGGVGIASDEFVALAGPGAEGTLMTFPKDPATRPEAAGLLQRLKAAQAGSKTADPARPDYGAYTVYAYAAVQVMRQAAALAGSSAVSDMAKAIHSGAPFDTVLGTIRFDANGDVTRPDYVVTVWRKGPTGRIGFDEAPAF